MRALVVAIIAITVASSCDSGVVEPLKAADYVGRYALSAVDGHQPGWYHQLAGVDCSAAFMPGELVIRPDMSWRLELPYNFRCLGVDPFDGADVLVVQGFQLRATAEQLLLNGHGPDLIRGPGYIDRWSLNIHPLEPGSHLEVRFSGFERDYWGDPVLTMGPRAPVDST
jgi:hypothetical protein